MITRGEPDLSSVTSRGPTPQADLEWIIEHQRPPVIVDRLEPIYVKPDLPPQGNELILAHEILDAKLVSLADLPDDWDSYGATAPSAKIIRDARAALRTISERLGYRWAQMQAEFTIGPMPDGISLEWEKGASSIHVLIAEGGYRWFQMTDRRIVEGPAPLPDALDRWADEVLCSFLFPYGMGWPEQAHSGYAGDGDGCDS